MIEVQGLIKSFAEVQAVRGISFSIARGEVVGLLGPNGAGKTTTMRVLTGYFSPDAGQVTVAGVAVGSMAARQKIGYLPESAPLYTDMEVTDFLSYLARLRNVQNISAALQRVIPMCGLEAVVGRDIGELSKGYCQRVGLAQALIHDPEILILDEPTSGLDPNQIIEIRHLITTLGKERTVILSTHILQEVEAMCGRALIMNQGQIVGQGTLAELAQHRQGGARYTVLVQAPESEIRARVSGFGGMRLCDLHTAGDWQEILLESNSPDQQGEHVFNWVVANGWRLRELRSENGSLEDTFRTLTKGSGA